MGGGGGRGARLRIAGGDKRQKETAGSGKKRMGYIYLMTAKRKKAVFYLL